MRKYKVLIEQNLALLNGCKLDTNCLLKAIAYKDTLYCIEGTGELVFFEGFKKTYLANNIKNIYIKEGNLYCVARDGMRKKISRNKFEIFAFNLQQKLEAFF